MLKFDFESKQFRAPKAFSKRSFNAASSSRLNSDWIISPLSADAAMRGQLAPMRTRSRDLERNNEWARGFLRTLENNVIGESGISLQMRVRENSGKMDEIANDKIETAWWQWGRKGKCTICGRHTFRDLQKLIIRSIARDGEAIIRKIPTAQGLKLQIIEADILDENANFTEANGNEVRFGVEITKDRLVVAYHLLGAHPGDNDFQRPSPRRVRVDASEIIHLFITERADQSRGFPWLVASMQALKMLDGYAEAELVAARIGAAKPGFFTQTTPDGWIGEEDENGNFSMDASPGTYEMLPVGVGFEQSTSDHPNAGYGEFVKSRLRGIATSLGISYNTLASDLEGVNYSSIRAGLLEEREVWKAIQRYLIEHLCEPIFEAWLTYELLSNRLGLPYEKLWKFNVPEFQGRRWAWVDPKKDMDAAILAIRSGQKSLRQIVAENGGDIFDVARSQKADKELFSSMGITLPELEDVAASAVSGAPASADGKPVPADSTEKAAEAGTIQSTGMNGAQVTALINLATEAMAGGIPVETAKTIAMAAFPLIPEAVINKIFANIKPQPLKKIDTGE